jgi:hypothetical protein
VLEKLGQTFFAVIMTKTPLLMGFLVYELNYHHKIKIFRKNGKSCDFVSEKKSETFGEKSRKPKLK